MKSFIRYLEVGVFFMLPMSLICLSAVEVIFFIVDLIKR